MRRIVALATSLLSLYGCAAHTEAVSLNGPERARITAHISALLAKYPPRIVVTPEDLRTPSQLLRALQATGAVRGSAFSRSGITASRACPDQSDAHGARCFLVGRYGGVTLIDAVESSQTLERQAMRSYRFDFQVSPQGVIGQRLATTRVLLCNRGDGAGEPWTGASTVSVATFVQAARDPNPLSDVLEIACPMTPAEFSTSGHQIT